MTGLEKASHPGDVLVLSMGLINQSTEDPQVWEEKLEAGPPGKTRGGVDVRFGEEEEVEVHSSSKFCTFPSALAASCSKSSPTQAEFRRGCCLLGVENSGQGAAWIRVC